MTCRRACRCIQSNWRRSDLENGIVSRKDVVTGNVGNGDVVTLRRGDVETCMQVYT